MKKFALRLTSFILLFYFLNLLLGDLLFLKKKKMINEKLFFPTIRWKEFYAQKKNSIDVIFLGSSRAYTSFNPVVFDSISGLNSFNMGSSSQSPVTSYFVLKEILKTQKPRHLVYEISHEVFIQKDQIINGGYNFDNFKNSRNKYKFFIKGFRFKEKIQFLFPSYRYRNNIYWLVRALFGKNKIKSYDDIYLTKGYVANNSTSTIKELDSIRYEFYEKDIYKPNLEYLHKLVTLCKDNDMEITFVYIPYPKIVNKNMLNREEMYSYYKNYINTNFALDIINYNTNNSLHFNDTLGFKNGNHLNSNGANKITSDIALRIKNSTHF